MNSTARDAPFTSTNGNGPAELMWPRPLGADAYCGLAGHVVRQIAPHTEADPAALLASFLALYGNVIGRGPHFLAGDAEHATNLFTMIVGETSSGRKGTSVEGPRRIFYEVEPSWVDHIASGLVSGEGVIHHIRDPRSARRKAKKEEMARADGDGLIEEIVDAGCEDKRLMLVVSEMAAVFAVVSRKDNTLSAVLRDLWDRGHAQTLAKNSPERCSNALVSILGHVTPIELRNRLDSTEVANGFANRFLFVASKRSKLLPLGGSIPAAVVGDLGPFLNDAIQHARRLTRVAMHEDAEQLWRSQYERLTTQPPGLVGALTGRAAPIVRRLALIYCLQDERDQVYEEHMRAALELWRYSEESVRCIFGSRLGERLADTCIFLLREAGHEGLTRNELRQGLDSHTSAERITDALELLRQANLAYSEHEKTGLPGRPVERWYSRENREKTRTN